MAHATYAIGLEAEELPAVRLLVALLRHPDPLVGELAHEALRYLQDTAAERSQSAPEILSPAG
jgi:hypothetical protein